MRLREARQAKGWTQAYLGELLGLGDSNTGAPRISRYERGMHQADEDTVKQLAELLGLPVAYFHASDDFVAEMVLLSTGLPPEKKKMALALMRGLAKDAGSDKRSR